jgi:hypothetical protein
LAQVSFPFAGFFRQDMARKSFFPKNMTASSNFETLLGCASSLHFWHFFTQKDYY